MNHILYRYLKEELPPDMTKTRGMGSTIRAYIDTDHAGESLTHFSKTGVLYSSTFHQSTRCQIFRHYVILKILVVIVLERDRLLIMS